MPPVPFLTIESHGSVFKGVKRPRSTSPTPVADEDGEPEEREAKRRGIEVKMMQQGAQEGEHIRLPLTTARPPSPPDSIDDEGTIQEGVTPPPLALDQIESTEFDTPRDPTFRTIEDFKIDKKRATSPSPSPRKRKSSITRAEEGVARSPRIATTAKLLTLDKLIPAGTIVLKKYKAVGEVAIEEDGWLRFERGVLEPIRPREAPSETAAMDDFFGTLDRVLGMASMTTQGDEREGPVASTSSTPYSPPPLGPPTKPKVKRSPSKGKNKAKTRRPSVSSAPSGSDSLIDDLHLLSSALVLRATFRTFDDEDDRVVVRIYLVPDDLEDRLDGRYAKGKRARPPASTVLTMLKKVRVDANQWEGRVDGDESGGKGLLDEEDQRSILEIYRAVQAPPDVPNFVDSLEGVEEETRDRIRSALVDNPIAMVTEMFPYQKASLAKMLSCELAPQTSIDPSYISCLGPSTSEPFYISVEGRVSRSPPLIVEPKSGILAEDMGSGKTCICLGLILSTKGELPVLDEGVGTWLDESEGSPEPVVMSRLSKGFPFEKEITEQRRLRPRVPEPLLPLDQMDAIDIEEYQDALQLQAEQDARENVLPALPTLRTLMIDYLSTTPRAIGHNLEDPRFEALGIKEEIESAPPFYYLHPSPTQLESRQGRQRGSGGRSVGRTGNIIPQEIVLTRTTLVVVPAILVKQWESEITKHLERWALKVKTIKSPKERIATVQEVLGYDVVLMSITRFSEAADMETSVLKKVHWKRLIVDEGHALSGQNKMRELAEELRCESRWAVSGTPSVNLRAEADTAASASGGAFAMLDTRSGGNETDFRRLGQIFSRFLRHPSFSKIEEWNKIITAPILGHGRGAARLARVMDQAVVRNPQERVRQVVRLPELTTRVVEIEMGELERKTYNALLAFFANNSILSQRTDKDYFFHESQKAHLNDLVSNLAASSFFFASVGLVSKIRYTIKSALDEGFTTEKAQKFSQADRAALKRSIEVMKEAVDDPEWRFVVEAMTPAIEVRGIDDELAESFGGYKIGNDEGHMLFSLGSLVTLRGDLREVRMPDIGKWSDDEELKEELMTFEAKRLRDSTAVSGSIEDVRAKEARKLLDRRRKLVHPPLPPKPLPVGSSFRDVKMGSTTSAKLNHVIEQCRTYRNDKFIIFSCTLPDLVFAILSEAFDLLGIKHIIFAGHARGKDRGAMAARFNETRVEDCQAILVDARLGGRGISLTAASRVIMLEPLWQPDLEVQAIKRAHRLGQTKPVDLSILVVKGSYEDALLQRRSQLTPSQFGETKLPQRDVKLRDVLQSARYLEHSPKRGKAKAEQGVVGTPLFPVGDEDVQTEMMIKDEAVEKARVNDGPVRDKGKKRELVPDVTFGSSNVGGLDPGVRKVEKSVTFA